MSETAGGRDGEQTTDAGRPQGRTGGDDAIRLDKPHVEGVHAPLADFRDDDGDANRIPIEGSYTRGDAIMSRHRGHAAHRHGNLGAVFALAWALAGLLGLGETATLALMAIFGLPGLYGSYTLTRAGCCG